MKYDNVYGSRDGAHIGTARLGRRFWAAHYFGAEGATWGGKYKAALGRTEKEAINNVLVDAIVVKWSDGRHEVLR